jgi:formylmethanofuran dehydrogenase subunit E
MPAIDEVLMLERQSQRLGVLWRSQGQAFLDEQAAALQEDVDRLREAYMAMAEPAPAEDRPRRRLRVPKVIDLREPEPELASRECSTDAHGDVAAAIRCSRCHEVYCRRCILQSPATHDKPLCTECALIVSGVHHKRFRPAVAAGRAQR